MPRAQPLLDHAVLESNPLADAGTQGGKLEMYNGDRVFGLQGENSSRDSLLNNVNVLTTTDLKMVKMVNFMLHVVYHNFFKKSPRSSSMSLVPITSPSLLSKVTTIVIFFKFPYYFIT